MVLANLPNGRDLGGRMTLSGARIRTGLAYRSAVPAGQLAQQALTALDVRTVVDLRTEPERTSQPDDLPAAIEHVIADVLADQPDAGAASVSSLAAAAMSGQGSPLTRSQVTQLMISSYEAFVTLPSARRATAQTLTRLAAAQPDEAVLFHCTAGKDRTGWMAALTYRILDVDPDEVMADYLASGPVVAAMLEPLREGIEARGLDLSALAPAMEVRSEYLDTSFAVMVREFGSLARFLTEGLGLQADFQEQMAARLLV